MVLVAENTRKTWILLILLACISFCLISFSSAFSHGASLAACTDMRPKHIRAAPQNTRKNYVSIHTNRSFYWPGDNVPVMVRSARDFMGFLLQARRVSNDQIAGSFVFIPPGSKLLHCFEDGDTVTHSDKSLKRNLSFVWKAPDQPVGDIKFFVSVVQSYFVHWARIESSILSQVQQQTTESYKSEISSITMSTVSGLVPTNNTTSKYSSTYLSSKPPDFLSPYVSGLHRDILASVESFTKPQLKSTSPSLRSNMSTTIEPSLQSQIPRISQDGASNKSLYVRNTTEPNRETMCLSCEERIEDVSTRGRTSPLLSTVSPDIYTWSTPSLITIVETSKNPPMSRLEDNQASTVSPSSTQSEKYEATEDISANFLHHSEDAASDNNVGIKAVGTSPWITSSVNAAVVPGKEEKNKSRGLQVAITQLGILLGCSAVVGMALAAVLRCIHAQYCHKRTEVSFSEPDNSVIMLQENGEMMHFKKIRENSFVLVQAEYNWIAPAGKGQ
uniref:Reeler domain containing 1 n=1 Tax=Leptobrachium leishanense TaxID=445787 RepID=A0A8C5P7V7_9ANUR